MTQGDIITALRDLIRDALGVNRQFAVVDGQVNEAWVRDRAANIAMGLTGMFEINAFPEEQTPRGHHVSEDLAEHTGATPTAERDWEGMIK